MNWLSQNWIWVTLAIGIALLLFRHRLGAHAGVGGYGNHHGGVVANMQHGALMGGAEQSDSNSNATPAVPQASVDPVSGEAVLTTKALTSMYQDRIYYFASKETREQFEAAPKEYAQKVAGQAIRTADAPEYRPRRRGGC